MALYNFLNESGFPGIDEYAITGNRIRATYEYGAAFSVDVHFWEESVDELGAITKIPITITEFGFTPYDSSMKCVKKNTDTLTISGSIGLTFKDAYYNFIMPDNSIKTLPMDTKEKYLALVKWSPPSKKQEDVIHSLTITYKYTPSVTTGSLLNPTEQTVTETKTFVQGIYWNYDIAVGQFQNALSKGTI